MKDGKIVKEKMRAVLVTPTIHDVRQVLLKQFGDVEIEVLSSKGTVNLDPIGIRKLVKEVITSVAALPQEQYYLVLAGLPLTNIVGYEALTRFHKKVSVLSFDLRQRRYVLVPNLSSLIWKEAKRRGGTGGEAQ
jgi:hypothetical protein